MTYFGGKSGAGVYQTIINQIPLHKRYIEPFLGGGSIMRKKRPAKINIGVELDIAAVGVFLTATPGESIEIITGCGIEYLRTLKDEKTGDCQNTYAVPGTFIYCDPPYPIETRGKTRYKFDFTIAQHIDLLTIIKELPFDIAISTYQNGLYWDMLSDWRILEYSSVDRSGAVRDEYIYMNYPEPKILHDDKYIGNNSNERQDIKRRISRTERKIMSWESKERIKLLRNLLYKIPDFERKYLLDPSQVF